MRDAGVIRSEDVAGFVRCLETADTAGALALALGARARGADIEELVTGLLAPAQAEVGTRWQANNWTVAQEHVATAVTESVLGALCTTTEDHVPGYGTLVLSCVEGEWHSLPARMAAERLRYRGWLVHFLGASMPPDHLASYLDVIEPRALLVSCTTTLSLAHVPALVAAAHNVGVPVLGGGRGLGPDALRSTRLGIDGWAGNIDAAHSVLDAWVERPPLAQPVALPGAEEARLLAVRRYELVEECMLLLDRRHPPAAEMTERAREATRVDLGYVFDLLGVTLLTGDERVLADHVSWTAGVLASRGLPVPETLVLGFELAAEAVGAELPATRALLDAAVVWCGSVPTVAAC